MITTNTHPQPQARRSRPADHLRRLCKRLLGGLRRRPVVSRPQAAADFQGNDETTVRRTVVLPLEVDHDLADWVRDTTLRAGAKRRHGVAGSHA